MQADQTLVKSAARWFLVVLPLGVWLRSAFVWIYNPRPFEWGSLIHAHSHTAYFGWAGLGLMGLILYVLPRLTGRPLVAPRPLAWLLSLSPWAVGGALVTFALWGYSAPSIAFSAVNEVVWFLFAYVFWLNVRGRPIREWPAALWLIGTAVVLLLVSTLSTVLIIITRVIMDTPDAVLANSGVYLFLQTYGDGWLEAGVMGVAATLLGGLPNRNLARWQALLILTLTVPASLRLLTPFGLGEPFRSLGAVAGAGLAASQVLYLVGMIAPARRIPARVRPWWLLAAGALALKAVLELLPLLPGWEALAVERNLVIAFLHIKLLTLVSAGLIGALAYIGETGWGFPLFGAGAVAMIGALAAHGFWAGQNLALGHALYSIAFWAGLVSATGAALAVWPAAFPGSPILNVRPTKTPRVL
ncbi:MAG TPA: hypothetical protein VNT75_02535 [Symbiobacteriaceae bacterium]|nr:hypothetical protein [Symbiobacteriaceae bacterium]